MGNRSGTPRKGLGPRPEAKPFTWENLTEDQRKVAVDIHDWLLTYLETAPAPERDARRHPLGWSIDQERPSNVLLIDGGRGSGKTSVLLSLLDLWTRNLGSTPEAKTPKWEALGQSLEQLTGRLIPVPVLDLQPLPPSTSLRTWIAGRLLRLAETLASRTGVPGDEKIASQPVWRPSDKDEPAWRVAWRTLLQDAAAGWHQGGGPDRSKSDPESLATELEQAELARLSIVDHWRNFVNEVASGISSHGEIIKPDARIVIPIDDADMNPARCVELLELLRTLWHPRVVFLLTGHSPLFLKTLTLHFQGVFRAQLGGRADSDFERLIIEEREPTPDDLAIQVYDKVLPPHQRFELKALPAVERLWLLQDVLDVRLQKPDGQLPPTTLREYFTLNPYVLASLPDRLRKVQNLRHAWDQLAAQDRLAAMITYQLWLDSLNDERHRLSTEDARSVEAMVDVIDGRIRIRRMDWRFHRFHRRTKHFQFQEETFLLRFTEAAGFAYPIREENATVYLPGRLNAALLLAVDLFLEERDERFDILKPMPDGFDNELVRNELTYLSSSRGLGLGTSSREPIAATWPLPDWRMSLDFAIFDGYWNQALRTQSGTQATRISTIAATFLWGVLAAYKRVPRMELPKKEDGPDWEQIAHGLVSATCELNQKRDRTERDEAFLVWLLGRAILLSAPESGLPPDAANQLLTSWLDNLEQAPPELREQMLHSARAERHGQASRIKSGIGSESEFLVGLDARFPRHQWAKKIEMRDKSGSQYLQKIVGDELSNFDVRQKNSNLSVPRNLRDYMDELQLQISVTPHFADLVRKVLRQFGDISRSTPQAIVWLWNSLVEEFSPENPRLKNLITLTEASDALVLKLPEQLEHRLESYERRRGMLVQARPLGVNDSKIQLYELTPAAPLDELSQFLVLVHDVLRDMNDEAPDWLRELKLNSPGASWFGLLPHAGTGIQFEGKDILLGWPTPRWANFLDWRLEERKLTALLEPVRKVIQNGQTSQHFRRVHTACLAIVLSVSEGIGEQRNANPSFNYHDQDIDSWRYTGNRSWRILHPDPSANTRSPTGNRWELVRVWSKLAVPFYATPEMGLPPSFAKGLLAGWMGGLQSISDQDPLKPLSGQLAEDCRQFRRCWVARSLRDAGSTGDPAETLRFLRMIDHQNQGHPWHQVFGAEPDTEHNEES